MSGKSWKLAVLPGDGIGPEVVSAALAVLQDCANAFSFHVETVELPFGGIAIDHRTCTFRAETRRHAAGRCCAPRRRGRRKVGLAATQPASGSGLARAAERARRSGKHPADPGLSEALRPLSPRSRPNTVVGEIVRELLGDLYFGKHTNEGSGAEERASDASAYSVPEIERISSQRSKACPPPPIA